MSDRFDREQERSRRLDHLVRSLAADNEIDAARSADLRVALAPFAAVAIPDHVREAFDARFAVEDPAPRATTKPRLATTAPFIRA